MVFSSLIFLFRFLPLTLLAYYTAPRKLRDLVLFLASLIFYAWGEPVYVVLILFSTVVDYTTGRLAGYYREKGNMRKAGAAVFASAVINLSLLGFFKYADFFLQTAHAVTGLGVPQVGLPLPIGISFYTFQTMSYTIDVYRGEADVQKTSSPLALMSLCFRSWLPGRLFATSRLPASSYRAGNPQIYFSAASCGFAPGWAKKC